MVMLQLHKNDPSPFGYHIAPRVSGQFVGGVKGERWFRGIWLRRQARSGEHPVSRNVGGFFVAD